MKNTYKIFLIVFAFTLLLSGCNLDVNVDPNRVTEPTVTGALIFPAAAHETGERIASKNFTFLNNWLGYWSGSGTFAIDATETTYNIAPDFGDVLFQNYMNALFDLHKVREKALSSGDKVLAGAAIILSARLWQDLVDIYGSVPYSQAFQFAKYPLPAYDKGQDIYADLQTQLDLGISYMGESALSSFSDVDIVNHGDKTKWVKFANTLKLRLLIHQSELGMNPSSDIAKIISNGGVLHSGETVSVNPGYENSTNKQSPFYANYGKTVNNADAAPSVRANTYFVDLLKSSNDHRLFRYFDSSATGGKIIPTAYGLPAGNPLSSSGIGPGLANNAAQNQWILTSVESMFLEAEAIARGWMPGDEETAFKAAVTESFIFLNVSNKYKKYTFHHKQEVSDSVVTPQEEADFYLNNASEADYSTVAGGSLPDRVKFIAFQKYLAMAGTDPVEAWTDLRRLGFDVIPSGYITHNPGTLSATAIPIRLKYPQSEYTTNAKNVNGEGTVDPFTTKIFWDVN